MSKKIRKIIFLLLVAFFLIIAPVIVVYSLGWRFDWQTKKIIQPGMFYFKTWPRNCQIYVNGEEKEKTDIFFGSVLIENLRAQTDYEVKIEKEGYYSWQKNLPIKKRKVTEAKNITLVPKNPELKIISADTEKFFFSPNKEIIITQEYTQDDSPADGKTDWSLKQIQTNNNVKSHLISQQDLRIGALNLLGELETIELISLTFSDDSKKAILTVGAKERLYYFILNIETKDLSNLEFSKTIPDELLFHPKDDGKLLVFSENNLKEFDFEQKELSDILIKDIISLYKAGNDIYYLTKEGFVFKTSDLVESQKRINIIAFDVRQESKYELEVLAGNIFLKESSALHMFNYDNLSFEKLLDSAADVKVSGDGKKISYFNGHEIWIMFLEKKYEQPQKEAKDKVFINRFSEDIEDLFWYTDHYLIFSLQDKIKVSEIDDRDKINIVDLAEYKEPKIYFANKKLYVLSENNFYASPSLTP